MLRPARIAEASRPLRCQLSRSTFLHLLEPLPRRLPIDEYFDRVPQRLATKHCFTSFPSRPRGAPGWAHSALDALERRRSGEHSARVQMQARQNLCDASCRRWRVPWKVARQSATALHRSPANRGSARATIPRRRSDRRGGTMPRVVRKRIRAMARPVGLPRSPLHTPIRRSGSPRAARTGYDRSPQFLFFGS